MPEPKEHNALEYLGVLASEAYDRASKARNEKPSGRSGPTDWQFYAEGESAGYNHAAKIMRKEMERLKRDFQNGCLRIDSFNIPL